jgi:hypothetical protein
VCGFFAACWIQAWLEPLVAMRIFSAFSALSAILVSPFVGVH